MRHRIALLSSVLAITLAGATVARADVVVLGLRSLEGDEALAERLTSYLRRFIAERGVDTVSDKTQTLEQMLLLSDSCGENVDVHCVRDIADLLGADQLIYGFIARMPGDNGHFTYAIDVRRFSASAHRDVQTASGTLEANRQGTANVQILASTLIDSLWNRHAPTTLIVQSNQPDAAVYVDDHVVGHTGAEPLWVADITTGDHTVRVQKDGFDPWERSVTIEGGQYRLLEAPLNPEGQTVVATGPETGPGEGTETGPGPETGPGEGTETGPGEGTETGPGEGAETPPGTSGGYWSDWHNWAGWGSIAAGVALAGGGLGFSLGIQDMQSDSQFDAYRHAHPTSSDVCSTANSDPGASHIRDICDRATTYQVMQFVMYGLGAAAAGVGIYFLVTAESGAETTAAAPEPAATLTVAPFAVLGGGGVGVGGTF